MHMADTLIEDEERRIEETVRAALRICGYPEWALKEGELRGKRQLRKAEKKQKVVNQIEVGKSKRYQVLPYVKGVTERLQRAFKKTRYCFVCKGRFYHQK